MDANIRGELNAANPNRVADALRQLGFGDLANLLLAGAETEASTIGGAVTLTSSQSATTAAATQTSSYVEADVQTIATLANALQVSYNAAQADIVALKNLVNQLRTAALSVSRTTETGVTVTSNVATLANQPSYLYNAKGTAGTATGTKALLIGPITGAGAIVPAPGQCVWDGKKSVLFSTADAITTADFMYATAADATASALSREIGQYP